MDSKTSRANIQPLLDTVADDLAAQEGVVIEERDAQHVLARYPNGSWKCVEILWNNTARTHVLRVTEG